MATLKRSLKQEQAFQIDLAWVSWKDIDLARVSWKDIDLIPSVEDAWLFFKNVDPGRDIYIYSPWFTQGLTSTKTSCGLLH